MSKSMKRALIIGGLALLFVFGGNAVRAGMIVFALALTGLFLVAKVFAGGKN